MQIIFYFNSAEASGRYFQILSKCHKHSVCLYNVVSVYSMRHLRAWAQDAHMLPPSRIIDRTRLVPARLIDVNGFQCTHPTWLEGGANPPPPRRHHPHPKRWLVEIKLFREGIENLSTLIGRLTTFVYDWHSVQGHKLIAVEAGAGQTTLQVLRRYSNCGNLHCKGTAVRATQREML